MPELHNLDVAIDQRPSFDLLNDDPKPEIVEADASLLNKEYADELAFMEEPVMIRITPGMDKNAATSVPVWVNGEKAEVYFRDRWIKVGYLPVGVELTVRRYVLEPLLRSKTNQIRTHIENPHDEYPVNRLVTDTVSAHAVSILRDTPRGHAWATDMIRRHY